MNQTLRNWCSEHKLSLIENDSNFLTIKGYGSFVEIHPTSGKLIDKEFNLIIPKETIKAIIKHEIQNVLFYFGGRYYFTKINQTFSTEKKLKCEFNDFKHIGEINQEIKDDFVHLGVHTEYELMNGTHAPEDWVKKAKFLKHNSLGICDENTLSGVLAFQIACKKGNIKSILGETITIRYNDSFRGEFFKLKLYVKNYTGWRNLLRINKAINVDNEKFIDEDVLLKYTEGLIAVFCRDSFINKKKPNECGDVVKLYKETFEDLYYQVDTVKYKNVMFDKPHLEAMSSYFNNFLETIEPVLINDSYYLDKEEVSAKKDLNRITKIPKPSSDDESYKNLDDSFSLLLEIFNTEKIYKNGDNFVELFERMLLNTILISDSCDFKIDVGNYKIPKFESEDDPKELFDTLLSLGMKQKVYGVVEFPDQYEDRLKEEYNVIVGGGFIDYFLILWDIVRWTKEQQILVGNGRGSVVGSLIAYLLDITTVDPIKHDLLFERFLNKARILPEKFFVLQLENGDKYQIPVENDFDIEFKQDLDIDEVLLKKIGRYKLNEDKVNKNN